MSSLGFIVAALLVSQPAPRTQAPEAARVVRGPARLVSQPAPRTQAPEAARVVRGPARLPTGTSIALGQALSTGPGEVLELLTSGRCLVRLAPGSLFRLDSPAPGTRCPGLRLERGQAEVIAEREAGNTSALLLGLKAGSVTLREGALIIRAGSKMQTICIRAGKAQIGVNAAPPSPAPAASPAPHAVADSDPSAPRPAPAAEPSSGKDQGTFELTSGRCWSLTSRPPTHSSYSEEAMARDRELFSAHQGLSSQVVLPRPDLAKELARLKERGISGDKGGTEVEGGGQSMCLETGGEGGAGDIGTGGSVEIVKPPPPTRLDLRVVIRR